MAGSSAPNKVLQHVYRCAITLPLTLIIPWEYIAFTANNSTHVSFWAENASSVITVIVISFIIYYLFEILTTKKPKNLLKATPLLLIIILFDTVFGFALTSMRSSVLNFKPTTDQIQSVSVTPYEYNYSGSSNNSNYQQNTYNDLLIQNIRFSDTDILSDTTKALDKNVDKLKSGSTDFYNGVGGQYQTYEVSFRLKNGKYIERFIFLQAIWRQL